MINEYKCIKFVPNKKKNNMKKYDHIYLLNDLLLFYLSLA